MARLTGKPDNMVGIDRIFAAEALVCTDSAADGIEHLGIQSAFPVGTSHKNRVMIL